jgi:tetratricopeptide (TPR) repeat protein
VKYCPSCGKAGIEGMKFCPRCGQRLTGFDLEEKQRYVHQPTAPLKERNWFERHLNWTLLLGIIGGPFLLFWIVYGVVNLVALFYVNAAAWIFRIAVPSLPVLFILIIVFVVRWYKERKRQRRTIADYGKATKLNPDNADEYYKRGDAYDEMGEYGKAITDYSKAIQLNPNYADAYYSRGCAYGEMGEYEKAIADYNKVIELNPNDANAYYNRGIAYREKGEVSKAVSDLQKCIGLSTDSELTEATQQALSEIKNSP